MKLIIWAISFFIFGVFGLVHQKFWTEGGWFNFAQFINQLCHEHLIVLCFVVGLALIFGGKK